MSILKAPAVTKGDWTYFHKKFRKQYALVITEIQADGKTIVGWPGFDGVDLPKKTIAANAKMLAASKKVAEALNALLQESPSVEDWMNARTALLAAGYTESK